LKPVYLASDNIISSLGFNTDENARAITQGQTGIKLHNDARLAPVPFWASVSDHDRLSQGFSQYADPSHYSLFEQLVISSVKDALSKTGIVVQSERTLFILSTTKGNIDVLDPDNAFHNDPSRMYLWNTARLIQNFFKLFHTPVVVSNACISGVLAVLIGARMIRTGKFDHVVVTGADLVTEFVLSGFNSFLSLCEGPCKPFDKNRTGLSLGEAAGTIVLTADRKLTGKDELQVRNGFSSNDANHISGPSRTGEGLYIVIKKVLEPDRNVDYISAHGTATPYNDEMESIALSRAGLSAVPVNSFKGYWGHTLGAAGIIEIVAGMYSMRNNILFKTLGYAEPGTSQPISVIDHNTKSPVNTFLKIASGFGGSNASLVITK